MPPPPTTASAVSLALVSTAAGLGRKAQGHSPGVSGSGASILWPVPVEASNMSLHSTRENLPPILGGVGPRQLTCPTGKLESGFSFVWGVREGMSILPQVVGEVRCPPLETLSPGDEGPAGGCPRTGSMHDPTEAGGQQG